MRFLPQPTQLMSRSALLVLSIIIVALFAACLFLLILRPVDLGDGQVRILDIMIGFLGASFGDVVGFWFGSSMGSHNKDWIAAARGLTLPAPQGDASGATPNSPTVQTVNPSPEDSPKE